GHERAIEHGRGAGNLGERGRDEPARAAFRNRDLAAEGGILLDHLARECDDGFGKQRIGHARRGQTGSLSWSTSPTIAPISPPAISGSTGAMASMTHSRRWQLAVGMRADVSWTIHASTSGRIASS